MSKPTAETIAQRPERTLTPLVDVFENKDELLLVADVPGVEESGTTVRFDKGQLAIEARRTAASLPPNYKDEPVVYRRAFKVPNGIDADNIAAEIHGGVLRVHLPKVAALKPRTIPVRAG